MLINFSFSLRFTVRSQGLVGFYLRKAAPSQDLICFDLPLGPRLSA